MRKYVGIMAVLLTVTAIASGQGSLPYQWANTVSGFWQNPAKWDDGFGVPPPMGGPGLPGSLVTDDAIFNTAGTYTVTLVAGVEDASVTPPGAGMGNIDVQSGIVTIDLNGFNLITAGDNIGNRTLWVGLGGSAYGELEVTGAGSFSTGAGISIGDSGGGGKLTFSGGVQVSIGYKIYAGGSSSSGGDLIFTNRGTVAQADMFNYGKGAMTVSDGATLNFYGDSDGLFGIMGCSQSFDATEGPTTFTVTGAGSALTCTSCGSGILMDYTGGTGTGSTINVLDGASMALGDGSCPLNPFKVGSITAINVTGDGSYMQCGTIELGGHDQTAYYQNFCSDHTGATSTLTVGRSAVLDVDAQSAAIADLVSYNNGTVISVGGRINIVDGSLLMNGTAGVPAANPGDLHIQFDETDHGMIIAAAAGQQANIAGVPILYSLNGGGSGFNPASSGFYDFIVADTIFGTPGSDNMVALLATEAPGLTYTYGRTTVVAGDYAGNPYLNYDCLRLSWTVAALPGDCDVDGDVDDIDLGALLNGWGMANATWADGDFDDDQDVDDLDLGQLLNNWGTGVPIEAVPEPASAIMLMLGLPWIVQWRHGKRRRR